MAFISSLQSRWGVRLRSESSGEFELAASSDYSSNDPVTVVLNGDKSRLYVGKKALTDTGIALSKPLPATFAKHGGQRIVECTKLFRSQCIESLSAFDAGGRIAVCRSIARPRHLESFVAQH